MIKIFLFVLILFFISCDNSTNNNKRILPDCVPKETNGTKTIFKTDGLPSSLILNDNLLYTTSPFKHHIQVWDKCGNNIKTLKDSNFSKVIQVDENYIYSIDPTEKNIKIWDKYSYALYKIIPTPKDIILELQVDNDYLYLFAYRPDPETHDGKFILKILNKRNDTFNDIEDALFFVGKDDKYLYAYKSQGTHYDEINILNKKNMSIKTTFPIDGRAYFIKVIDDRLYLQYNDTFTILNKITQETIYSTDNYKFILDVLDSGIYSYIVLTSQIDIFNRKTQKLTRNFLEHTIDTFNVNSVALDEKYLYFFIKNEVKKRNISNNNF